MHQNNEVSQPEALDIYSLQATQATGQASGKVYLDLLVLRYMAQRIHVHLLNLPTNTLLPSVEYAEEHHNRIHRIIIYKQQEFLSKRNLMFVGFISGIQEQVTLATIQEIHRVDKLLVAELANNPGLLSYSSLELRKGYWYNLVLLSNFAAKTYFKNNSTHRYAAHHLAAHYYTWIRLHNGVMPGGLLGGGEVRGVGDGGEGAGRREASRGGASRGGASRGGASPTRTFNGMILQSTKYYAFPGVGQKPVMRELFYDDVIDGVTDGVTCSSSVFS